ncbi:MAG TPA: peptidoglycan DD-metalloendopeptidase family protein [Actinomycetota bacterium]|nr:peptidoglycan DD-metalloendopeptidase family protein [Actinomycetota bacterium]
MTRQIALVVAASLVVAVAVTDISTVSLAVSTPNDCAQPEVPGTFHAQVVVAIRASRDLPARWATSDALPKIVCWQETAFDPAFRASRPQHVWHGVFAMTLQEMKSVAGPELGNDRHGLVLHASCFLRGWDACKHTTGTARVVQQLVAGLRWIWWVYGDPSTAWNHIVRTGRFNSYPRPGTDDTSTRQPFALCPVDGVVSYTDDFGMSRTTGGYHLHSGNDVHAPLGRMIRAPFAGLVVRHVDDWLAGRSVGLVGAEGFARNAHLSRFGRSGYVPAGAVIGYVGMTGDARSLHDHFEWHPWNVPVPLRVAPTGVARIRDAIDPFPFLNQVCHRS